MSHRHSFPFCPSPQGTHIPRHLFARHAPLPWSCSCRSTHPFRRIPTRTISIGSCTCGVARERHVRRRRGGENPRLHPPGPSGPDLVLTPDHICSVRVFRLLRHNAPYAAAAAAARDAAEKKAREEAEAKAKQEREKKEKEAFNPFAVGFRSRTCAMIFGLTSIRPTFPGYERRAFSHSRPRIFDLRRGSINLDLQSLQLPIKSVTGDT